MNKLTVVIPCKNDPDVVHCVKSIDSKVEVLIVFNGSSDEFISYTKKKLTNFKVNYEILQKANLSWSLETGTRLAKTDLVLYMDSDCIFEKAAVQAFIDAAQDGNPKREVYKGDVIFAQGKTYLEKLISKSRSHHTAEVLTAYKPPLMISKTIKEKIGGYIFDNRLIWREDSDLDNRIRAAQIKIVHVPMGIIHHKTIKLKTDLRSTYRYGIGLAIANQLKIKLTEVPRSVMSTYKSKGVMPAAYMIFRNRVYDLGYWVTRAKIYFGIFKLNKTPDKEA